MAAGLLDRRLSRSIFSGFKGKLHSGFIERAVVPAGTALDGNGDPAATVPQRTRIEGFVEGYSAFVRAQAGIPATDFKVNIFSASAPGFTPVVGDRGHLNGRGFVLRGPVETDPAGVLWTAQAAAGEVPSGS